MFEKLEQIKPALKKLIAELDKTYAYASVLAVDDENRGWRISRTGKRINNRGLGGGSGYVVRVFDGVGCAEYSFNEFSEDRIPQIVKTMGERIAQEAKNIPGGITPLPTPIPSDEPMTLKKVGGYAINPKEMGDEAILARLEQIRNKALTVDGVLDAIATISYRAYRKLFISKNRDLDQTVMYTNGAIMAMSQRGEEVLDAYKGFSTLGGAELLKSEPMIPGEYDCICDPDTTGMIVHEAFGHGVEMDMFVKDRALAANFIDERVASDLVTMHDGNAVDDTATCWFDDEGTLTGDTVVISNGILQRGMCDALSASRLGVQPTGNGRRESYERKVYTRMTNTYFEGAKEGVTPEDMIASVKYGFLLESPSSGMEDPKNWGIQCMVTRAREIKDGKLTGKIYSPIVLTGYVPDLLKSVSMMSSSLVTCGSGFCGKGYKEWVKVSDGGPYMKARIRLG